MKYWCKPPRGWWQCHQNIQQYMYCCMFSLYPCVSSLRMATVPKHLGVMSYNEYIL